MADLKTLQGHYAAQKARLEKALEGGDFKAVSSIGGVLDQIQSDIVAAGGGGEEDGTPGGGGGTGTGDVIAGQREQDALAAAFDKLSPAELYRLYTEDKPTWQKIMDAKERAGWKRLFGF
jgi:hypothetical protein